MDTARQNSASFHGKRKIDATSEGVAARNTGLRMKTARSQIPSWTESSSPGKTIWHNRCAGRRVREGFPDSAEHRTLRDGRFEQHRRDAARSATTKTTP
ncbi:hypothetical protein [Saccharopolyspora sp. NPDC002376]